MSSDRLKAFASVNDGRNDSSAYDDDFEGELMTIKGPHHWQDNDPQEQTIRPLPKKTTKTPEPKSHSRNKSSSSRAVGSGRTRSPTKSHFNKFELPSRPDVVYREQSIEDFSDLFVDNDSVFTHKVNQAVRRVSLTYHDGLSRLTIFRAHGRAMHHNYSIHQTSRLYQDQCRIPLGAASRRSLALDHPYFPIDQCDVLGRR